MKKNVDAKQCIKYETTERKTELSTKGVREEVGDRDVMHLMININR